MYFGSGCSGIEAASVKLCTKCSTKKPTLDGFHLSKRASDGLASWCKTCVNSIKREPRQRVYSPEDKRKWALKSRYNLTPAQYQSMLTKQGGKCALCSAEPKTFHVDHCHNTGKVRGLLCHKCNIRLGGWDDLQWREAAIAYLGLEGEK